MNIKINLKDTKKVFIVLLLSVVVSTFCVGNIFATSPDEVVDGPSKIMPRYVNSENGVMPISENEDYVMPISEQPNDIATNNDTSTKGVFDFVAKNVPYKFSDTVGDMYLPYVRYMMDRVVIDKEIKNTGTTFSSKSIEVNSATQKLQTLFSSDTVRINNTMEYALVFATQNVIVDSTIEKDLIVFAGTKLTITDKGVVKGDIIAYTSDMEIAGIVEGNVVGMANNINVSGSVKGDLRTQSNTVQIATNDTVEGKVYIESYTNTLTLPNVPKAEIKIMNNDISTKINIPNMVFNGLITSLVFTLVYLITRKISKKTNARNIVDVVKAKPMFTIMSGPILLIIMPILVALLVMLSVFNLYMITIPLLLIYIFGVLIIGLLSTLIVGSFLFTYVRQKYLANNSMVYDVVGAFATFAMLYAICRIPVIGAYATIIVVAIAIGITLSYIFMGHKLGNSKKVKDIEDIKGVNDKPNTKKD